MYPYISVFGRQIGTYGLCLTVGVVVAVVLAMQQGKPKGLMMEDILIVSAFALGFAFLSGSILYVFVTYSCAQIWSFILHGDFGFLSSGIVFYGGLIGGMAGALLGIRVANCDFRLIEESLVPFVPLGHAIGRIGCVMSGCCNGFAYDGPFAIYYPNSVTGLSSQQGYFPVQPLEALVNIGISFLLLRYKKSARRATDVLFRYLELYAISRFYLEMLRGDVVRGVWNNISTSQIISIIMLGISIVGLRWNRSFTNRKKRKKAPLS